jgi:hypothetical protein
MGLAHQKPSPKAVPKLDNLSRLYRRAALDANTLAKRGLLVQSGDVYSLFSPSFDYWIGREIAAGPQEQESPTTVETWLAEGGRENLQPMKGFLPKFKRKYWPLMGEVLKEISFEVVAGVLLSKVL